MTHGTGLSVATTILGQIFGNVVGTAANVGANLAYAGWSREQEIEADDYAVKLAHEQHMNPVGMLSAGSKANARGIPVVFDPVGVGASSLRTETAAQLFGEVHFAVIRGNASEIRTLADKGGAVSGVDANAGDKVTDANFGEAAAFAKAFALRSNAVIVMSGAIDIVASARKAYAIRNGDVMIILQAPITEGFSTPSSVGRRPSASGTCAPCLLCLSI